MSNFVPIEQKSITFSDCASCKAQCCSGLEGICYTQIILDDFKKVSQYFPIVFKKGDLGYLKPVILLTNGYDFCKYIEDYRCTIYKNRPSVCKAYPLSPTITNEVYIDKSCPSLDKNGDTIVKNGIINPKYQNNIFKDYQDKYLKTHFLFHPFNKDENLEILLEIKGEFFYKFKSDIKNEYIKLHQKSLKHIDDYFISSPTINIKN